MREAAVAASPLVIRVSAPEVLADIARVRHPPAFLPQPETHCAGPG